VISTHDYFLACPNGGFFDFNSKQPCQLAPLSCACLGKDCDRRSYLQKLWRVARSVMRRGLIDLSRSRATIHAVHEGMVDHLVRGGISADQIIVLRNPVSPWSSSRIAVENNRKVLFVGRLDHDKGAELLAQSARDAGVPLQIVGEGPLRALLGQSYPEAELMGWQSREQVARIAKDVRMVVMPTASRESFGLVAFEALTSGIPVIISSFASTADEITRKGLGYVCDPYDVGRMAELLRLTAKDDEGIRLMSERAYGLRSALVLSPEMWSEHLMAIYRGASRCAVLPNPSAAFHGA
jgi:glycosyltransferase involved in cell wall biosynthesis